MNEDKKKGKTITPILLGVLVAGLVFGLGVRYMMDKTTRTGDTEVVEEQDTENLEKPEAPEDTQDVSATDLGTEDEDVPPQELPQVYEIMKGKWVLYEGGWKYPERYIEFDGNSYTESLGEEFLKGNPVDPDKEVNPVMGKYRFEVSDDPWKGQLIFNDTLNVDFSILYEVGRPPYIEISESKYLLSRENWEEDYEDQPNFVPYTK